MKKTLLILLAFFTLSFTYSQEWELIVEKEDGQQTFMRPHSINSAWIKIIPFEVNTENDKMIEGYLVQLMEFDCRKKKNGVLAYFGYDKEGNLLDSYEFKSFEVKMEYSPPESMGEYLINNFCENER